MGGCASKGLPLPPLTLLAVCVSTEGKRWTGLWRGKRLVANAEAADADAAAEAAAAAAAAVAAAAAAAAAA